MRLLLDTQIFCWSFYEPERLSRGAFKAMRGAEKVFVSSASIWEIAIKVRLDKIYADPQELFEQIEANGFQELPVWSKHALLVAELAMHHGDPFDRLLIAQAMSEPLHLLTADPQLKQYSELVILV
ncbi:MAG: type II toxin-antitoxin system VapC family toxin [Terracidiphilus sp.]|jgi:PIN domain nuclease of toxin-antitoxin system